MPTLSFLLVVIFAIRNVQSARILGLFPHPGKSHQMVFDPLMRTLAERGHDVTVVSFFPIKDPPARYTSISLEGLAPLSVESGVISDFDSQSMILNFLGIERIVKHIMEFQPVADLATSICSKMVDFEPLADALKKNYDIFLVENFNSDCMLGLAHVYGLKVPHISLSAVTIMEWGPDRIGVTDNPSYVPILSCGFTSKMTFLQRLENAVMNVWYKMWFRYGVQMKEKEIIEKRFGRTIPDLQELAKNVSLTFVNAFHSLSGVRPLLPGVVEVGGMFLNHSRKAVPNIRPAVEREEETNFRLYNISQSESDQYFRRLTSSNKQNSNPILQLYDILLSHLNLISPEFTEGEFYSTALLKCDSLKYLQTRKLTQVTALTSVTNPLDLDLIFAPRGDVTGVIVFNRIPFWNLTADSAFEL